MREWRRSMVRRRGGADLERETVEAQTPCWTHRITIRFRYRDFKNGSRHHLVDGDRATCPRGACTSFKEKHGDKARATRRAYKADWKAFTAWMTKRGLTFLPSDYGDVEDYVTHLAEEGSEQTDGKPARVSTIERCLSGMAHYHREAGFDWFPTQSLRKTMKAIRRKLKVAKSKKRAVTDVELRAMITVTKSARDRALILVGWHGAMRRSEIVKLNVENTEETNEGLLILIESSKVDQEGAGELVGLYYAKDPKLCPVRALRAHLDESGIKEGAIFRSRYGKRLPAQEVAFVVQETATAAGFDGARFGGHSLRAGFATTAAQHKVSEDAIQRQGRWRNVAIVRGYYRNATVFDNNATKDLL